MSKLHMSPAYSPNPLISLFVIHQCDTWQVPHCPLECNTADDHTRQIAGSQESRAANVWQFRFAARSAREKPLSDTHVLDSPAPCCGPSIGRVSSSHGPFASLRSHPIGASIPGRCLVHSTPSSSPSFYVTSSPGLVLPPLPHPPAQVGD